MAEEPGSSRGSRGPRFRDQPRLTAYDVLRAVDEDDAYANLALARLLRERGLSGRDAALTTELVGGTLRGRGTYDAVLDSLARRPLDPPVRDVLRLGSHQLLSMRVPDHAAIDSSVALTRHAVGHRPAGFVNAVLRQVAGRSREAWVRRVAPDRTTDPTGHLAVAHSHPRWVVESLATALARPEELDQLLAADNDRPVVHLVARPGLSTVAELGRPDGISPFGAVLDGGDPGAVAAVREGRAVVQDPGSQLVALVLARAALADRDERWLDLCAGPGGKAALLAALAQQQGARLTANEPQPHRAELVRQAVRGSDADVVVADGRRPPWPPETFDRVLVDAPCSGLGALRRRPEARWRRQPEDLAALVPLQRSLLEAALVSVRPGGIVAYATCSPVLAETADVVAAVAAERDDVRLEDATALLPEVADAGSPHLAGAVQLWPHRHGTDAMFVALLRRTGER